MLKLIEILSKLIPQDLKETYKLRLTFQLLLARGRLKSAFGLIAKKLTTVLTDGSSIAFGVFPCTSVHPKLCDKKLRGR